jgi:mannose-1-phosphate guanylyltransferase/mannose-6-phosphate isomerase
MNNDKKRISKHGPSKFFLGLSLSLPPPPIKPVILCCGSGTRFWPLSRRSFPKQFVPLIGNRSLLQLTLERVSLLSNNFICIPSAVHMFLVAEAMQVSKVQGTILSLGVDSDKARAAFQVQLIK